MEDVEGGDSGGGNEAPCSGVYSIILDLIREGKDARFVNREGRYLVNWCRAVDCYLKYIEKKDPQFKRKKISRKKASNKFLSALLNHYKGDGAVQYMDSRKFNKKKEVIERQLQMPKRFESFYRDVQYTDDSGIASEDDSNAEERPTCNSSASDKTFGKSMDISTYDSTQTASLDPVSGNVAASSDMDTTESEENIPTSQCGISMVAPSTSRSDRIFDETSDTNVQQAPPEEDKLGMNPKKGFMKGGYPFFFTMREELPKDMTTAKMRFAGVGIVDAYKLDNFTIAGCVPPSRLRGVVQVTAMTPTPTPTEQVLGMDQFEYMDEKQEILKQFLDLSKQCGFLDSDTDIPELLALLVSDMEDQDSSSQIKQKQSVNVIQLLVYTAAQTGAQQFIEMIFSTSAGEIVFNSYKDRTPLPEDIARANGHEELAQFLQDINNRLSKKTSGDVHSDTIDWLELVKAVQKRASAVQDESSKRLKHPCVNDDNSSDYFADAETSSWESFDLDTEWSDSEDKGPCIRDGESIQEPTKEPVIVEEGTLNKKPVKKRAQIDNEGDKESVSSRGFTHSFSEWLSKWRKREDTSCIQEGGFGFSLFTIWIFILFIILGALMTVSWPGLRQVGPLHAACKSGNLDLVKALIQSGSNVNARNVPWHETPLHLAARYGHQHIAKFLIQRGCDVNARNFPQRDTPLHLAAQNGHSHVAKILTQHGGDLNARNDMKQVPLHLAAQNGHKHVAEVLIQHGGDVSARNSLSNLTPLHLAARNGHKQVVEILIQHGGNVSARDSFEHLTPLHLAAQNGHKQVVEVLIHHGGNVSARNSFEHFTPLHLAAQNGHKQVVGVLIHHGGDVNARASLCYLTPLHLAAQNGHKQVVEVLIHHGGNVNARVLLWDFTPLHLAARNGHKQVVEILIQHGGNVSARDFFEHLTPLHLAAQNGHKQVVEVLIHHGGNVNARDFFEHLTPLHLAAQNGHKQVVEVLIHHGGDVSARDYFKHFTPLHLAAQNGHKEVVEVLIHHGGDVNARDSFVHLTPLHLAARNGHKLVVEVLIQHGGNVSARDSFVHLTPLHLAARNGHKQVVEVFIQHGGNVNARDCFEHCKKDDTAVNELFQKCFFCDPTTKRQSGPKPLKVILKQLKIQSQHLANLSYPDNFNLYIASDSNVIDLSHRNVNEVLSWHGPVSGFTGNSAEDSIIVEVFMYIVVVCLVIFCNHNDQPRVWFNPKKGERKEKESTPGRPTSNNFQRTVTQNQHIEAGTIELRMERVRSWLAHDHGQEQSPSVDTEDEDHFAAFPASDEASLRKKKKAKQVLNSTKEGASNACTISPVDVYDEGTTVSPPVLDRLPFKIRRRKKLMTQLKCCLVSIFVAFVFVHIFATRDLNPVSSTQTVELPCETCRRCPPGERLSVECGDVITSQTPVSYVLGKTNSSTNCENCGGFRETTKPSTLTSKVVCGKCKAGAYLEFLLEVCKPCSPCCNDSKDKVVPACKVSGVPANMQSRFLRSGKCCKVAAGVTAKASVITASTLQISRSANTPSASTLYVTAMNDRIPQSNQEHVPKQVVSNLTNAAHMIILSVIRGLLLVLLGLIWYLKSKRKQTRGKMEFHEQGKPETNEFNPAALHLEEESPMPPAQEAVESPEREGFQDSQPRGCFDNKESNPCGLHPESYSRVP